MTQALDLAHKRGHVYEARPGAWTCTSHGKQLERRGGVLVAPCCGLEVEP